MWTLSCYTSNKSGEKKEEILLGGNRGNVRRKGGKWKEKGGESKK